jgi:uncharacterized protein
METFEEVIRVSFIPLFFLFFPFLILKLRGHSARKAFKSFYIKFDDIFTLNGFAKTMMLSTALLVIMLFVTILLTNLLSIFGYNDLVKVEGIIKKQTFFVLAVAILFSPLAEEIFFRGFLQKIFGVYLSALAFGLSHFLYGSIAELIGAMVLGLAIGLFVKRQKALFPAIIAHILYNAISVFSALQ